MITWPKRSIGTCASITELNVVISGMSTFQSSDVKILWDFTIQTDKKLPHNKPDIVVVEKTSRTCQIIDVQCSMPRWLQNQTERGGKRQQISWSSLWSQNPLEAGYHYTNCYRSIGDLYRQTGKIPRGYPCWASDPHNAEDRAVGLSPDPETSFGLLRLLVAACARTSSMILLWFGTHYNNYNIKLHYYYFS